MKCIHCGSDALGEMDGSCNKCGKADAAGDGRKLKQEGSHLEAPAKKDS